MPKPTLLDVADLRVIAECNDVPRPFAWSPDHMDADDYELAEHAVEAVPMLLDHIAELTRQIAVLTAERDQYRADRDAHADRCQELASQVSRLEERCEVAKVNAEEMDRLRGMYGRETSASIAAWALSTFGSVRSNLSTVDRAQQEMNELRDLLVSDDGAQKAVEEVADVAIVLSRIVAAHGKDLQAEIDRKMIKNRARKWKLTGDGHGQHVEEQGCEVDLLTKGAELP